MLVMNSYTGEMFPVDSTVVRRVIRYSQDPYGKYGSFWSKRIQTIYDLLMAGF